MTTRRKFMKLGAMAGAGLMLPWGKRGFAYGFAQPSVDPALIPKYLQPLVIPPAMPRTRKLNVRGGKNIDYYEIAVRQFQQHILPPGMGLPPTTVWSYGSANHPGSFHYPAFTIEAKWKAPVRVKWINGLKDASGNYLSHLLPVDPTLHWANPPGGMMHRDHRPHFSSTPGPYTGPVPIVTHVHGMEGVGDESDGYAEAWYLPAANNIPAGYAAEGTWYNAFKNKFAANYGPTWAAGTAEFQYPNTQRATTLWYHDHTLGMTRLNVYAGPAGFYLLRGGPSDEIIGNLPGPAPALGDPPGMKYYEIPLAIQDRSFNDDGSLFYPDSREFFDGFAGPYVGSDYSPGVQSDISPIWNPEFFGNAMVVNGRTWPYLEVEQRRYRFRFLNGCNSRFLILRMDNGMPFYQIGSEGGFLPAPVMLDELLMSPAERADVVVDFTALPVGTTVTLLNLGPDEPFGGGVPGVDFPAADPTTTGQVMQFRVVGATSADLSTHPMSLILPTALALGVPSLTRQVSLNEADSAVIPDFGPLEAQLGGVDFDGLVPMGMPMMWNDPITENPSVGATEVWEIFNFTMDAHPIHVHNVQFQVVNRQPFDMATGALGFARGPETWESGFKDTVIAYPGEITRIKSQFPSAGLFVWHCHIVEHEDNEMMRPYRIGP